MTTRVLLVEDEVVIRKELRRFLARNGYEVVEAGAVREALADLAAAPFDLVLADVRLPGGAGTELLGKTGNAPVVMMTSYATVKAAVDAMRLGAADYVSKPFDHDELLGVLERVLRARTPSVPPPPVSGGPPPDAAEAALGAIVGESASIREVRMRIQRVAPSDLTVLVLGESGTGKELVAQAIHQVSRRHSSPFVPVNCASIPDSLIESELFGHEKGAFTGAGTAHAGLVESASMGTLFLDEIGELPLAAQARLLRVLQEKEVRRVGATRALHVDVRLVAATHRDLPSMVQQGTFRGDLYFRLRVVELRLPPLRERPDDLLLLAAHVLARACARTGRARATLSANAQRAIIAYPWPGNVRELENALERALVFGDGNVVEEDMLSLDPVAPVSSVAAPVSAAAPPSSVAGPPASGEARSEDAPSLEEYFRRFVLEHEAFLSETEIARRLGISRKTLWERRQRLNVLRQK
jgi:DNA-binding NtrC family response regulator